MSMYETPDERAASCFESGAPLAGVGDWWDAWERLNGRAPDFADLVPVLIAALRCAAQMALKQAADRARLP